MKVIKTITETSIIKEMAHRLSMPIFWFADKNIKPTNGKQMIMIIFLWK